MARATPLFSGEHPKFGKTPSLPGTTHPKGKRGKRTLRDAVKERLRVKE